MTTRIPMIRTLVLISVVLAARGSCGSRSGEPAERTPAAPGVHREGINACKGGPRSTCDFVNYTGPLAESVILANAAFRAGGGFDWNAKDFKASGNPKADDYIFPDFRDGWKV